MDGELVTEPRPVEPVKCEYSKYFTEIFPYYLSIGMSEVQYWDGDPILAVYYRKSQVIKEERDNRNMWLQGAYFYEALCDVSPVLHAFAKKGTKPTPYRDRPYPITKEMKQAEEEARIKASYERGKQMFERFAAHKTEKAQGQIKTESE